MEMNWFESVIFGFVSGLTEFLPVSSQAHEALLLKLFGISASPLLRLLIHAAVWEALYLNLSQQIRQMLQDRNLARIPPRRRSRQPDPQRLFDLRLLQTALVPLLLGFAAYSFLNGWQQDLSKVAVFLLINGFLLYIPRHLRTGNKDSRSMTGLDGILLGFCGALSVFPGVSRVGAVSSAALGRGADKEHALRWSLHLNLIGLLVLIGFDAYDLFLNGVGTVAASMIPGYLLAIAAAFGGAFLGIHVMRFLAVRTGFSGFAYYSWGAALFAFLLYLTI